MNSELQSKLWETYPKIFSASQSEDGEWMGLFCECDDGWYEIINSLCRNIQHTIDWNNATGEFSKYSPKEDLIEQVIASQIKEKFGGLRFYYDGGYKSEALLGDILGMVAMAEAISLKVCETCGSPGKLKKLNGWYKTCCDSCEKNDESS